MNAEKFEQLCRELLAKSDETLFSKSKEYATDEDRLANFRQPTSMMDMSPAEVCLMYQMKHISSIAKIAKESSEGILPTKALVQEKCQDMLNYTLIFYTIMCEMIEKASSTKAFISCGCGNKVIEIDSIEPILQEPYPEFSSN